MKPLTKRATIGSGDGAITIQRKGDRSRLTIHCSTCPNEATSGMAINAPGEVVARVFRQRGWRLSPDQETATCPQCQEAKMTAKTSPSPAAFSSQRAMWRLLEDNLERVGERCRYAREWSDDRVAKESGMAPQYVAEARAAEFGALVDPEREALERALDALGARLDELDALHAQETKTLREDLARLRGRLQAMEAQP